MITPKIKVLIAGSKTARKLIKEKRDEIDELMKKYEMPNKNSSKILIINQNYEKHSHIPEMWYEFKWRKSAEEGLVKSNFKNSSAVPVKEYNKQCVTIES